MSTRWTKRRGLDPGALMDEALLHDAKVACFGGSRGELIVREVSEVFLRLGRKHVALPYRAKRRRLEAGVADLYAAARAQAEAEAALTASGRRPHD
eukprot:3693048-Alexandrium_andersonii.AAC.1